MAITSVGYAGTVGDAQWALMIPRVGGSLFGVDSVAALKVTAAAGTRTIQIASGRAWASGILDTSNAAETKALASVPSGIRWDLVVLRRNWATKATTIEVVQGGSSKELPTRQNNPGVQFDQPLALVRVAAGQAAVQEIIDLRCVPGDAGLIALDDLARSYLSRVGTSVRIGDVHWDRVVNAAGSPVWISTAMGDTGWIAPALAAGWDSYAQETFLYRVRQGILMLGGRGTGTASAGIRIFTLPTTARHNAPTPPVFTVHSDNGPQFVVVSKTGDVVIASRQNQPRVGVSLAGVTMFVN